MNNEPQMCNKGSPPRTGTIRAIGAAAGYLALYFGIRFAATLFIAVAYFIVRLPADLETTYTLDLILSYIGEISFVEIISSTIAMFAAVWVIGLIRDRKKPLADHVGFFRDSGFVRFSPVLVPLLIVLGFTLNMFVSLMLDMLPIPEDILNDYAEQSSLLGETTVLSVLATAIFAPLSEELVFRGLLISRLRRGMPVWLAALIPSVIFGLIHGQILWISYALLLGLYLSMVCIRAGSTAASALLHTAFNATSFILPLLPIASYDAPRAVFYLLAAASGIISAALTVVFILLTKKKNVPRAEVCA